MLQPAMHSTAQEQGRTPPSKPPLSVAAAAAAFLRSPRGQSRPRGAAAARLGSAPGTTAGRSSPQKGGGGVWISAPHVSL